MASTTESGIPGIGKVEWGKHVCHFYRSRRELVQIVVKYIVAGLRNNQRCIFGAGAPFYVEELKSQLLKTVRDPGRLRDDQLTLFDHHEWYAHNALKDPVQDLLRIEKQALRDGYSGLRCGGIISWITRKDWKPFFAYEANVSKAIPGHRILALCGYDVSQCDGEEVFGAIRTHHYAVAKQGKTWGVFETTQRS